MRSLSGCAVSRVVYSFLTLIAFGLSEPERGGDGMFTMASLADFAFQPSASSQTAQSAFARAILPGAALKRASSSLALKLRPADFKRADRCAGTFIGTSLTCKQSTLRLIICFQTKRSQAKHPSNKTHGVDVDRHAHAARWLRPRCHHVAQEALHIGLPLAPEEQPKAVFAAYECDGGFGRAEQ